MFTQRDLQINFYTIIKNLLNFDFAYKILYECQKYIYVNKKSCNVNKKSRNVYFAFLINLFLTYTQIFGYFLTTLVKHNGFICISIQTKISSGIYQKHYGFKNLEDNMIRTCLEETIIYFFY